MIDFLDRAEKMENQVLCIDFDGVIHKSSKGFHDGTIYDEPVEGTLEAIKELSNAGYEIIICTCKCTEGRPLINGKDGAQLIWEWLEKYNIVQCVKDVTNIKPHAKYYIDDKAIRFENWKQTLEDIK